MKKILLFILVISCFASNTQAQFCNKQSCYQQNTCYTDSQINKQDYKYATVHNIYKSATASIDLYMTVYSACTLPVIINAPLQTPTCKSCKRPFIMLIHGGGFRGGCRKTFEDECMEFAKRGYVVATIDYRLGWVNGDELQTCSNSFCFDTVCAPFQDDSCKSVYKDSMNFELYRAVQDASAAMRFIAHYADKFNIDKNYLYIGGHSAGSLIAVNLCYVEQNEFNNVMPKEVAVLGAINSSGNPFIDTFKIAGLFNNWGSVIDTALINGTRNKIPMIAFHGIDDSVIPFAKGYPIGCSNGAYDVEYGSSVIYTRLTNKYPDLPVELYACYGGHGIFVDKKDPKSMYRIEKAICFFNRVRNGDKARTYIRINKDQKNITYAELDSTSPINCNYTALLNENFYANNATGKNLYNQSKFIIYPNPSVFNATLHISKETQAIDVTLTNGNGKILWSTKSVNVTDIDLPVQNISSGLYFVTIKTAQYSRVLKLIKAN